MSYLEDLRREAEEVRQLKERTKQEAERQAERHSQRRQQAETFWEESGVGNLVVELKSLLRTTGRLSEVVTTGQKEEEKRLRFDPDSKIELLRWDPTTIEKYKQEISSGWWGASGNTYNQYRIKQGLIEALPEGDIIFRGNQVFRVPQIGWRTAEGLLGRSMDAFLNDPTFTTYYDPSSRHPYKVSYLPKQRSRYPWE